MGFWDTWEQCYPPAPELTEKDVKPGSHVGKVFIITGGNSGIGFELVKFLYPSGATIYLASRSIERVQKAIDEVTAISPAPETPGILKILHLDLSDLTTVKPAAAAFAANETGLDILWNNAGSGAVPGSVTKQGIEAHIGSQCVAVLLFTTELLPLLQATAKIAPKDSVRVIWTGSLRVSMDSPPGGVDFERIEKPTTVSHEDYGAAKAGNWFLAREAANRWGRDGIISVCHNPGNIYTPIFKRQSWFTMLWMRLFFLHPAKFGAYTMLFSGFSPKVNESTNGAYIWPWGRIQYVPRADIVQAADAGKDKEFWEWCEKKWKLFV